MRMRALCLNAILLWATLAACGSQSAQAQATKPCSDPQKVIEAFYAANDAGQFATSLQYLTDDITLFGWAEGANGRHMTIYVAVGGNQVQNFLAKPGLRRIQNQPNLPNYTMQDIQLSGLKVTFMLMPDRLHPNNRPYNHYSVEAFFSGCQIEILKVVERVTWL